MSSFTDYLLALDETALGAAVTHPFLTAAANDTLPEHQLLTWLAQDRLYAISYVNFVGALLSKVRIPTTTDRRSSFKWRVTDILINCLTNIRTELKLFEDTAHAEGGEEWLNALHRAKPDVPTRAYQDLFAGATAPNKPLIVGLVVLWATEECYLRAWKFAKQSLQAETDKDEPKGVMQRVFIPNWTSDAFETFVESLRDLVNEYGLSWVAKSDDAEKMCDECEIAFRQVLWAEHEFWPRIKA